MLIALRCLGANEKMALMYENELAKRGDAMPPHDKEVIRMLNDIIESTKWGQGLICDHVITDQALNPVFFLFCELWRPDPVVFFNLLKSRYLSNSTS